MIEGGGLGSSAAGGGDLPAAVQWRRGDRSLVR